MNFVFYLLVIIALAVIAIIGYPVVKEFIKNVRADLKNYYDEYDDDNYQKSYYDEYNQENYEEDYLDES